MRVLHIVPSYLPATRYGGPIYSVHALCRALSQRGHDVNVYTTNVDGAGVSDVPLAKSVSLGGVTVRYFPTGLGRRIYRSPEMGRALGASIRAFDVVHLHSVFLWPTWAAARAATKAGVPYLLSPRGMLVGALLRRKSRVAKSLWINLVERPNLKNAAAIHVTSGIEGEELLKLGLPVRRIVDVPNGVEMPSDRASGKPWHPSAVAVAVRPYVLCLGRVSWKKGLDQLILAMVNVRNAELVIAGNDEENYQPKLEAIARKNGIADRVHFLGPVHGEEKWAIIRSAAVFALPSYSENFGNAVLEAMACGIPVVVTPEVGLAAAVRDIGAGLVVKSGASALAGSIVSLLENAELRKRMGEAGRRSVQEMFSWSAIAQRMETVYDQCRMERTLGA